jgi:hypothetical protein
MNLKPISMKPTPTPISIFNTNNKQQKDPTLTGPGSNQQQYELVESSVTVRENEEFLINCVVESSKPAADISFRYEFGEFQYYILF